MNARTPVPACAWSLVPSTVLCAANVSLSGLSSCPALKLKPDSPSNALLPGSFPSYSLTRLKRPLPLVAGIRLGDSLLICALNDIPLPCASAVTR